MSRVLIESEKRITGKFSRTHLGLDLGFRRNEQENIVTAHSAGKVIKVIDNKNPNPGSRGEASYGNFVLIDHGNGYKTRYAHLKKNSIKVKLNDWVEEGTALGIIGDSGNAYGRHLHFEVHKNNVRINPEPFLNKDFVTLAKYQAHDAVHGWHSNVPIKNNPSENNSEYAGLFGYAIDAISMDDYTYRTHDKIKNIWLPWVKGRNDYAGNLGNAIDGIQIKDVTYRAHLKDSTWLPWVNTVSENNNGYAGIYGKEIDAYQIKSKL